MIVVIDSSVWSFILRRRLPDASNPWVHAFREHVSGDDAIVLLGPILQELLSGLRWPRDFERLLKALDPFPLVPLERGTHILAARISNQCRRRGVQTTAGDCLIAAGCVEYGYPLLTADQDFARIARHCDLRLLPPLP